VIAAQGPGSSWCSRGSEIQAGYSSVVPINAEKLPTLTSWQDVSGILYNIAIATAAVHGL